MRWIPSSEEKAEDSSAIQTFGNNENAGRKLVRMKTGVPIPPSGQGIPLKEENASSMPVFLLGVEKFEFLTLHKYRERNSFESLARGIPPVAKSTLGENGK